MTGHLIKTYLPIFREKLARLEARGLGGSPEAVRLRKAIGHLDHVEIEPESPFKKAA